jgi:hypothetical protein
LATTRRLTALRYATNYHITAHFEAAVVDALTDPSSDRAALAEEIEELACWTKDGEAEGSPSLALTAQLTAPSR